MTSFRIPWRLLIPPGSVDTVIGADGGLSLQQKSGAKVSVSTSEEAPVTLSDKIVKIEGTVAEQEEALAQIVAELFEFQGTPEDEDGICVLVMPSCAVGAVIGAKGSKISEIMSESGAEIDVGRECIIGMPDNPVVLRGRPQQIVRSAALCNAVLQDLAGKGRVSPEDFCYVPGRTSARQRPGGPSSPLASPLPSARLLVEKDFAGFLIGKGGEKIKRLRDQTGATLQFRGPAEEVTLILGPDQRVLDIRGSADERNEAIKACFVEMDAASHSSTKLLLPLALAEVPLQEAAVAAGASAEMQDDVLSPESSERVVHLSGDSSARLAAVLALLTKADAYAPSLSQAPQVAQASQVHQAPQAPQAPQASQAPQAPQASQAPQAPQAMPKPSEVRDSEQSQGFKVIESTSASPSEEKKLEPESGKIFTFQEFRVAFAKEYSEKDIHDYWRDACQPVPDSRNQPSKEEAKQQPEAKPAQSSAIQHRESSPNKANISETTHTQTTRRIDSPTTRPNETRSPKLPETAGILKAALESDSKQLSQLHLLLPSRVVKGPLVVHGHLANIAAGCNVELDVCEEVSPGKVQVTLKGTCAAVAMATLALQMHICFHTR